MPPTPSGAPRETSHALSGETAEQLRQLTASPLDATTAPQALALVLETVHMKHGALLRYDSEAQSLSLLAYENLGPHAVDAIRLVRRGVGSGVWDMPLHAVLQRRVYIIDRPKENPFVPTLLTAEQGMLTNAALIPLFAAGTVTGALLLVGSGKKVVHETDILALREIGKAIGVALRQPSRAAAGVRRSPMQPIATPPREREDGARDRAMLVARVSELESLVESLRRAASSGPSQPEIDRKIAEIARERDRYKSEGAMHELALRTLRSETDLLRDQGTADAERARRLALDLARAKEELAAATESGKRSSEEIEAGGRSRAALEQRLAVLERQLGETASHVHSGEATRTELTSRLSTLEAEAEGLRKSLQARDEQIAELRGERERLTASLQKAGARYQSAEDVLAQIRESSETTVAELRADLDELRRRAESAERERDQLSAGLSGRSEVIREIERETERYRADLERETERRRVSEQTVASVLHDAASLREEAERMQAERQIAEKEGDQARENAQRLAAELQALRASSAATLAELRQQASALGERAERAESLQAALAAEAERLRPDLESSRRNEADLRSREAARDETERRMQADLAALRRSLDEATDAAREANRERESLQARVNTLQETSNRLLAEGEALRTERDRLIDEQQGHRTTADTRGAEAERLGRDVQALRAAVQHAKEEIAAGRSAQERAAEHGRSLEQELVALRTALQESQSRGSELTAELAQRARAGEELRAAVAAARQETEAVAAKRRESDAERAALQDRLQQLEQALQGASANLAEKSRESDFSTVLRATLAKSESARRSAEDAAARLEAELAAEREQTQRFGAETESEREAAQELARRVEEIEQRLADSEEAAAEASQQASLARSDQEAAQEAAQSLAAELGRRAAELSNVTARLEASERRAGDWEAALQAAQARTAELEQAAREATQGIDALKRQAVATQDEKARRIHELELHIAETGARTERVAAELKAAEEERERLRESVRTLEEERRQAGDGAREAVREAAAKAAAVEAAARLSQAESERLAAEIESMRQRAAVLENDLRGREAEGERWRALAERLESTLEEREREVEMLRTAARAQPAPASPAPTGTVAAAKPAAAKPAPPTRPAPVRIATPVTPTSRTIVILDEPSQTLTQLSKACAASGFEPRPLDNGSPLAETPGYTAVNLLAPKLGGLEGLLKSRTDELLSGSRLLLYACRPGGNRGLVFSGVDCLIRPLEEKGFVAALAGLLGNGKRVTIIGEELDSVLKLNAWATAKGCSVSSAGDLKQGSEILDIVKPDLIVFDFSRLGGEGAALVTKARRSARLEPLPVLLVLPPGAQSASAPFFLKRLAALADEATLDFAPIARRLSPPDKA